MEAGMEVGPSEVREAGAVQDPHCCRQHPWGHREGATGDQQMIPIPAAELKHAQLSADQESMWNQHEEATQEKLWALSGLC